MPFKRENLIKQISERLNLLAHQLKTFSRASFTDASHSLEFVMARFFNALFGWQLTDLNAGQANFPAADLGDRARRIAMQITIEDSSRKISGTAANAAWQRDLSMSHWKLADLCERTKQPAEARAWWRKAHDTLAEMQQSGSMQPIDAPHLETLRAKVAGR